MLNALKLLLGTASCASLQALPRNSSPCSPSVSYLSLAEDQSRLLRDRTHGASIWPFEQALIHSAADSLGLLKLASVARRCDGALIRAATLGERLVAQKGSKQPQVLGPPTSLRTVAAASYFADLRLKSSSSSHLPAGRWVTKQILHKPLRGVRLEDMHNYLPDARGDFHCRQSKERIRFDAVNDDFCDCEDQSDEPSTSACPQGRFFCDNRYLPSHRVGDGLQDCKGGEDEARDL